jgi:hypothetical protein
MSGKPATKSVTHSEYVGGNPLQKVQHIQNMSGKPATKSVTHSEYVRKTRYKKCKTCALYKNNFFVTTLKHYEVGF